MRFVEYAAVDGSVIKDRRKELHLSLTKLAFLTDLSRHTIHKLENQYTEPSIVTLAKIVAALELRIEDVLIVRTTPISPKELEVALLKRSEK